MHSVNGTALTGEIPLLSNSRAILFLTGLTWAGLSLALSTVEAQPGHASSQLSFTAAQVSSGEIEYKTSCMDCHGAHLDDGEFGGPPLRGFAFMAKWAKLPPSALVSYVRTAMPADTPGRLPPGTYIEIVAYILNQNGLAPATKEMPADMSALAAQH